MNTTPVFDAPPLDPQPLPPGKWAQEYEAFSRQLPELLRTHRGQFVAVHGGRVVGAGPDKLAVAKAAYERFGPVEVLVRLVTDHPARVVRLVTPRVSMPEGG